jgi:hypothetical protein
MAVTRSSKKQSHIEDYTDTLNTKSNGTGSKKSTTSKSSKRAVPSSDASSRAAPSTKKQKTSPNNQPKKTSETDSITINRSPGLQLWSACVAHFLHPELSWEACINIGSAIATLCAVSKGKAIGMIESPADQDPEVARKKEEKKAKAKEGARKVDVMGFNLPMKSDAVVISGSEKRVKEGNLIGKYGGEDAYKRVRQAMEESLKQWAGKKEELGKRAFGMYEDFRPSVPKGEKGWGRKGELRLEHIRSSILSD